jgi:copper(I)-binding protein
MRRRCAGVHLAALMVAACAGDAQPPATSASPAIEAPVPAPAPAPAPEAAEQPPRPNAPVRMRTGRVQPMPPGSPATAAYFTLQHDASAPLALAAAESPVAAAVELHEHKEVNGMMMMRPVTAPIALPANGTLVFAPGGYHVMLIGLKQPLALGDTVPLTLVFDDGSAASLRLPVAPPPEG